MDWFALSLLCALSLASADAATKAWLPKVDTREIALVRMSIVGLLLTPIAFAEPLPPLPLQFWGWIALLVPLEIVAMLLYMRAIRDYPLAETVPYLAFTPVLVVLTGWVVLGERVSSSGLVGIACVVAGSWLLSIRAAEGTQHGRPFWAVATHPGARLMLLVASIYAITSVGGKAAMQWLPAERFGSVYFALLGLIVLVLFGALRPRSLQVFTRHPWATLIVALFSAIMVVTHFMALARIETAYMIAVKRSSLLFGILYGALLFGEPGLRRNLTAGSLMLAGVALLLIGPL